VNDLTDIIRELDGNGLTEAEAVTAAVEVMQLSLLKERLNSTFWDEERIKLMLKGAAPSSEQQRHIVERMETLSARERECYILRTVAGLSYSKIGEKLGVGKWTARTYVDRAKEKMLHA
jgi:RNA polymerase sigma factor (sigma-70 family)